MMNLNVYGKEIDIFDEQVCIYGIWIDQDIFNNELADFKFVFVDDEIDTLMERFANADEVDKENIKNDLEFLFSWRGCYAIFGIHVNKYMEIDNGDMLTIKEWAEELLDLHFELHPEDRKYL